MEFTMDFVVDFVMDRGICKPVEDRFGQDPSSKTLLLQTVKEQTSNNRAFRLTAIRIFLGSQRFLDQCAKTAGKTTLLADRQHAQARSQGSRLGTSCLGGSGLLCQRESAARQTGALQFIGFPGRDGEPNAGDQREVS